GVQAAGEDCGEIREANASGLGSDRWAGWNVIRSEVEKVAKLKDPAERKRQIDELSRRYAPLVQRACEVAGIDPGAVRQESLAAVPGAPGARVEPAAGPAISWHTDPDLARPSPRPLQSFNEIVLAAPYQLQATLGVEASADSYSGRIGDDNWIYEVG